ncbi:DivIVA domain-containing protein [Fusibacter sp. 3D3]|uniref:DivIVA domain-containing protein n=1 Tax=Fusibacter sp. 3D3 TaxID=1048380 RepID=UPI000853340C|nr:DivIVA domain-containing protein [Fusibacter sp. 3D3]GAU78713.1 cell division initiation protein DivIVA [Fusibacter sp. 3D3]
MLTPLDIQNKHFSKGLRGYNETEVEEYMAQIVKSMEALIHVNIETTARINELEKELKHFKTMEKTITDAMVLAQKTSEDIIRTAESKAQYRIEKADDQAKKVITDANTEVINIIKRQEHAKQEFMSFNTRFKVLLESQLQLMESQVKEI